MKYFLFLLIFLIGCNGERETPDVVKTIIVETPAVVVEQPSIDVEPKIEPELPFLDENPEIEFNESFVLKGTYGEVGCPGKIYRKDFEVSYLYVFVDCKNNMIKQIVRK